MRRTLILTLLVTACAHSSPPTQLEDDDVLTVLREHREQIAACRRAQLEAAPVEGLMTVYLTVQPDGSTSDARVSDGFDDTVLAECVIDAVRTWRFGAFTGDPMPIDFPVRAD